MNTVIKQPLITEKMTSLQEKYNQYAFIVDLGASKKDIKKAIHTLYPEIHVLAVNTVIMPSKPKGRYTRSGYKSGRSKKWKKAIITIGEGETIDFFSEI